MPVDANRIIEENYRLYANIGASFGGTKFATTIAIDGVNKVGEPKEVEWQKEYGINPNEVGDADKLATGMANDVKAKILEAERAGYQIRKVWITAPGPLDFDDKGNLLIGTGAQKQPGTPFHNYRLKDKIAEILNNDSISVDVIHDGYASVMGEWKNGGLKGAKNGVVEIAGSGIGWGILHDENPVNPLDQKRADELFPGYESGLTIRGRNLIYQPTEAGGYEYKVTYRETGGARHVLKPGEEHIAERIPGPYLAKRLADTISISKQDWALESADEGLRNFINSHKPGGEVDKTNARKLLTFLTQKAIEGNQPAKNFITAVAEEYGQAMVAEMAFFLKYHPQRIKIFENIVHIGGMIENIGKGLEPDLFIEKMKETVYKGLIRNGFESGLAERIRSGIKRSELDYHRELDAALIGPYEQLHNEIHNKFKTLESIYNTSPLNRSAAIELYRSIVEDVNSMTRLQMEGKMTLTALRKELRQIETAFDYCSKIAPNPELEASKKLIEDQLVHKPQPSAPSRDKSPKAKGLDLVT